MKKINMVKAETLCMLDKFQYEGEWYQAFVVELIRTTCPTCKWHTLLSKIRIATYEGKTIHLDPHFEIHVERAPKFDDD